MKNINALVKELCVREGLKSQTGIGNVREVIGHLSDLIYKDLANVMLQFEDPDGMIVRLLHDNGKKRAKKKTKKS